MTTEKSLSPEYSMTFAPYQASSKSVAVLKTLQDKFEVALDIWISGQTPKEVVLKRPARGGLKVDYVPGWWFIEQLNALFAYDWDFEIVDKNIGQNQIWVQGKLTVRSMGKTVSKQQFGGSDIKKLKDKGDVIDIGDDLKSAATDAFKKCCISFGFCPDVYGKREALDSTGASKDQLTALYSIGEKAGMTKEEVDTECKKKFDKTPGELEQIDVLGLINDLRKKIKKE
jgi:hypothetical protein